MRVRDEAEGLNECQVGSPPITNSSKVVLQLQHPARPNATIAQKP